MSLSAKDYVGRARNSVWERNLASELRQLPEEERLAFVQEFATINTVAALELASRCLSKKQSFETLLDQGMNDPNPSAIQHWLKCVVPRLGFRLVIYKLRDHARTNSQAVGMAQYWLPTFSAVPGYSQEAVDSLSQNAVKSLSRKTASVLEARSEVEVS